MSKRHTEDSDSEAISTSAKRPRRDVEDANFNSSPAPTQSSSPATQMSKATQALLEPPSSFVATQETLDKSLSDIEDDPAAEERIRKENLDKIRAELQESGKKRGTIGDLGLIQKIDLTNFMCHKRLTVQFGPQVNFIIGHNGSGKSAILTALTIALGAKASVSGRGSGIKSFIKEGESTSEVEITVKNMGPEAFKPTEYGSSITVIRRFTKEGSSSYKLKNHLGKVVSSKREELMSMCDHMLLQVDNPMNVLTQDAARQFLSAAHPKEKYALFLKGTNLSQLAEEYESIRENIQKTNRIIDQKKTVIPDLQARHDEWKAKVGEATAAETQRQRVDEIKSELAWAYVEDKEVELKKVIKERSKIEREQARVQRELETAQDKHETAGKEVNELEANKDTGHEEEELTAKKQTLTNKIKENKKVIAEGRNDEKQINKDKKELETTIQNLQLKIDQEEEKMKEDRQGKLDGLIAQIREKEDAIKSTKKRLDEIQSEVVSKGKQRDQLTGRQRGLGDERDKLQQAIMASENHITRLQNSANNELAHYGNNIEQLLGHINRETWTGKRPIGPLGRYVKIKDRQYADVLRGTMGRLMFGFVVENSADRSKLLRMLQQSGNPTITITVSRCDLFDYSRGEPPAQFLTVLRALEITDPWVERVLINSAKIESVLLCQARKDAGNMLRQMIENSNLQGGLAWTCDNYAVRDYGDGGRSSNLLEVVKGGDPRRLLFTGGDTKAQIEQEQGVKAENERKLAEVMQEGRAGERLKPVLGQEITQLNGEDDRLRRDMSKLQNERQGLQDELAMDSPVNLAALEESKSEHETQRDSLLDQFKAIEQRVRDASDRNADLVAESEEIRERLEEFSTRKNDLATLMETALHNRLQATKNINHWQTKLSQNVKKLEDQDAMQKTVEDEFQEWTRRASESFERVDNPRKSEVLKKELENAQAQVRQGDQRRGYTLDEAQGRLIDCKNALNKAKTEIKDTAAFVKSMKDSMHKRHIQWKSMRSLMTVRTKEFFQFLLGHRGYSGSLEVDHDKQELNLKVRTDDQAGNTSKDKDPRALSGGEKSYATICLLLALWKSLDCPIRCLDEFDVFMDSVNRKVSMDIMMKEAKGADNKQHILITPQDMSNIKPDPAIKIQRLNDPERNQGVLAAR